MADGKVKVLIVDDDAFLSGIYATKLELEGFEVVSARDGEEGLKVAMKEKPALILLDVLMPKLDGFEVLKRLKADAEVKDIPVIMLTNLGQKEDIEKGLADGAVAPLGIATAVATGKCREPLCQAAANLESGVAVGAIAGVENAKRISRGGAHGGVTVGQRGQQGLGYARIIKARQRQHGRVAHVGVAVARCLQQSRERAWSIQAHAQCLGGDAAHGDR